MTVVGMRQQVESEAEATPPRLPSLAPYAASAIASRGRRVIEPGCPTRAVFQRDRDRIIHSTGFRRLTHKTQVFLYHEGDHYRSRLTHSLEVAQIARTMARQLQLDEDLAEALALSHDLGHPPFGHAGERALDRAAAGHGGFDHNAQSFRVVTRLERKYADFDGLNLSWETLEGLVKHNGPLLGPRARAGLPPVDQDVLAHDAVQPLLLDRFASAEAQLAALADDIAYNNHDLDDGLRAGLVSIDMLRDLALTEGFVAELEVRYGDLPAQRMVYELNRRLITLMVNDVVAETRKRLAALQPATADDIRMAGATVVAFSEPLLAGLEELQAFLYQSVYRHPRVVEKTRRAETIVTDLFVRYLGDPSALPESWRPDGGDAEAARARQIVDFVAGMTDRYAVAEHRRLFDETPDLG
jgi:dGTPase